MLSGSLAEERLPGGGTQRGYRPHSTSLHGAAGMQHGDMWLCTPSLLRDNIFTSLTADSAQFPTPHRPATASHQ